MYVFVLFVQIHFCDNIQEIEEYITILPHSLLRHVGQFLFHPLITTWIECLPTSCVSTLLVLVLSQLSYLGNWVCSWHL